MYFHTFELSSLLPYESYQSLRDFCFQQATGHRNMCFENTHHYIIYNGYQGQGLGLRLEKYSQPTVYLVRIKVNPSKVLGNTDALSLFEPTEENMVVLFSSIDTFLGALPTKIPPTSLTLTRVDLCKNIPVPAQEIISAYLRLLEKGARRRHWNRERFEDDRDNHSFRLFNERYQITVYDKLYQILDRNLTTSWDSPRNILRVEVSLLPNGISHMERKIGASEGNWIEKFRSLAEHSDQIMENVLEKAILPGDYYSLTAAEHRIQEQGANLWTLGAFLRTINRSSHVDPKAIKSHVNGKNRLAQLQSLGINPVTIECRAGIDFLPSLLTADIIML